MGASTRLSSNLVALIKELTQPLLEVFDFIQVNDQIYADIVNEFVKRVAE